MKTFPRSRNTAARMPAGTRTATDFMHRSKGFPRVCQIFLLLAIAFSSPSCGRAQERRKAAAEAMVSDLSSPERKERLKAVVALVDDDRIGFVPESALEPLLKMAAENDKMIRSWTMTALGMLGPAHSKRTSPVLIEALKDGPDVAIPAAMALGRLKPAESVPGLVKITEGEDLTGRHYAAEALSHIGTEEAKAGFVKYTEQNLPALLKILEGTDEIAKADAGRFLFMMQNGMKRLDLLTTPEAKKVSDALRGRPRGF